MLRFLLLTVLSAPAWTIATVCCAVPLNTILISYNAYGTPVNLLNHPVLLASGRHYIDYQLDSVIYKTAMITYTRSSATAEKQRVSCAFIPS